VKWTQLIPADLSYQSIGIILLHLSLRGFSFYPSSSNRDFQMFLRIFFCWLQIAVADLALHSPRNEDSKTLGNKNCLTHLLGFWLGLPSTRWCTGSPVRDRFLGAVANRMFAIRLVQCRLGLRNPRKKERNNFEKKFGESETFAGGKFDSATGGRQLTQLTPPWPTMGWEHSDEAPTNKIYRRASSEQRLRTRSCHESERLV